MRSCWTAAPITAEGPRKGEPSTRIVRYGLRTQTREISPRQLPTNHVPAVPTRAYQCDQSSRQLLGRYRLCCPAGSSRLTSRNLFPPSRPAKTSEVPQRCSPARVRFAPVGPLPAPRRSGPSNSRDGRLRRERLPVLGAPKKDLTGRPHINCRSASPRDPPPRPRPALSSPPASAPVPGSRHSH